MDDADVDEELAVTAPQFQDPTLYKIYRGLVDHRCDCLSGISPTKDSSDVVVSPLQQLLAYDNDHFTYYPSFSALQEIFTTADMKYVFQSDLPFASLYTNNTTEEMYSAVFVLSVPRRSISTFPGSTRMRSS